MRRREIERVDDCYSSDVPASPPLATSALPWVQGMRPADDDSKHELTWQEVLLHRLRGSWNEIPTGERTATAEDLLGFAHPMSYFFVGRCIPELGANAIASYPLDNEWETTPFDTGALASGEARLVTEPVLAAADWPAFVASETYANQDYEQPMSEWIDDAFDSAVHYVDGATPSRHAVSAVDLAACSGDDRIWTWEVRMQARRYIESPVDVKQVYFQTGTQELYLDWIDDSMLLTAQEKLEHHDRVYAYSEEVEDAAIAMVEYLRGGVRE